MIKISGEAIGSILVVVFFLGVAGATMGFLELPCEMSKNSEACLSHKMSLLKYENEKKHLESGRSWNYHKE